jgi:hypothetical protein
LGQSGSHRSVSFQLGNSQAKKLFFAEKVGLRRFKLSPLLTFFYLSLQGQGWLVRARVKGKAENDLMKLPFILR